MTSYMTKDNKNSNEKYDLYGIIVIRLFNQNHSGSLSGGHYTSIIKLNNKWIKYDDSSCYEITENSIKSSQAYLLIYRKQGLKHNENFNYMRLLENIYFKNSDDLVIGEPIKTPYGKGYLSSIFQDDKTEFAKVKFRYGHITFK